MSSVEFTTDASGALKKVATMKAFSRAAKYQLTRWAAETVQLIKRAKILGVRSGQLMRNVGMKMGGSEEVPTATVGTGVGSAVSTSSKYAKIQDVGGTTHPNVTEKMRRWAWAMFIKSKEDKYKWIALTSKAKLDVKIPASGWFTYPLESMRPNLDWMISPEQLWAAAERMKEKGI
jgi:hypothetical protein